MTAVQRPSRCRLRRPPQQLLRLDLASAGSEPQLEQPIGKSLCRNPVETALAAPK